MVLSLSSSATTLSSRPPLASAASVTLGQRQSSSTRGDCPSTLSSASPASSTRRSTYHTTHMPGRRGGTSEDLVHVVSGDAYLHLVSADGVKPHSTQRKGKDGNVISFSL